MTILTVGIVLAKNDLSVHGDNEAGKAEPVRPAVPRKQWKAAVAAFAPCLIGMEVCSGAHHGARDFQALGHTLHLIAPKFATPYRNERQSAVTTTPPMSERQCSWSYREGTKAAYPRC